jgi:hypothetical protein
MLISPYPSVKTIDPIYRSLFEVEFEGYPELSNAVSSLSVTSDELNITFNSNVLQYTNHLGIRNHKMIPFDMFKKDGIYPIRIKIHDKAGVVLKDRAILGRLVEYSYGLDYASSDVLETKASFSCEPR